MKKKWIILMGAVVALGALVATAAAHKGGKRGHGMRAIMQELDLSDEQKEQLKELHGEHREQLKDARGEGREALRTLRERHMAAVGEILDDEQRERFAALREEMAEGFYGGEMRGHRGHGKRGWGGRGHGHGPRAAFSQLDLSDEQKEQLKGLRGAHREEMGKLRKGHREAVEKVLTAEQREKLEELKDEAFYGGKRRHRMMMH